VDFSVQNNKQNQSLFKNSAKDKKINTDLLNETKNTENEDEILAKHTKIFSHCGYTYSKRNGILVLENNAGNSENLKMSQVCLRIRPISEKIPAKTVISLQKSQTGNYLSKADKNSRCKTSKPVKRADMSLYAIPKTVDLSKDRITTNSLYPQPLTNQTIQNDTSIKVEISKEKNEPCEKPDLFPPSVLHPRLTRDMFQMYEEMYVGNQKPIRPKSELRPRTANIKNTPFCRYKEFTRMKKYNVEQPCVRNGSPYKSEEEKIIEEMKKSKIKWINKKGFMTYGCKHAKGYKEIKNYVTADPSDPPVLHKFRVVDKNKWIGGSFKL